MKKSLLSLVCLLVSLVAMGEPISREQAKKIASGYLDKNKGANRSMSLQADLDHQMDVQVYKTDNEGNALIYVVNYAGGGYVIVSGDDRMRQVLGYSNSGKLDMDTMPTNMRYWLQGMSDDIQHLIDIGYQPQEVTSNNRSAEVKPSIRPMLPCHWGQEAPYNNLCPLDAKNQRTLTGCLATAMAQVMYYHYKVRNADIPATPLADTEAYTTPRDLKIPSLKAADYTIDWSQLVDKYKGTDVTTTETQKQNVAKLMAFCGATLYMDYDANGSSAEYINMAPALKKYFGFSPATRIVYRSSYTEQQWAELMYNELTNGRPVLYSGNGNNGGHQFVLDGYDGNEMFHINWGWDGQNDNYFALSVLNSNQVYPVGASETMTEYTEDQAAVINAEYGGTAKAADRLSMYNYDIIFDDTVLFSLINNTGVKNSFEVCLAYKDLTTGETGYVKQETWNDLEKGYYRTLRYTPETPSEKSANHSLILYPVSRVTGTSEWLTVSDPYLEYAKATYDADGNLTLTIYPTEKLSTNISVEGNRYTGTTHQVKTTLTNTGDERQLTLYYWIKFDPKYFDNTRSEDLKYNFYSGVTAQKGATHTDVISFTPVSADTYYIWVTKDKTGSEVLAKTQVTINANPHKDNGLALSVFNPKGLQTTTVQPNGDIVQEVFAPSITPESFIITNTSKNNLENAVITFNLRKKNGTSWTAMEGSSLYNPLNLEAGKSTNVNGWSFVEGVGEYLLELVCNGVVTDSRYINTHESYVVANAYGKLTPTKYSEGTITTPADATALALDYIVSNSVTIKPNTNPNTLYYQNAEASVTGLEGKNIVNGNEATSIVLEDGNDFSVAYGFRAQNISYKRTFEAGWTTLTVPFDVKTIPEGITALAFVSENGGEVTFKQVSNLAAFAPYLVKAETAKTITFTGSNQQLWSEYTDAATALNLKFMGVTTKPAYSQAYVLNADGTKFELTTSPTYQSFRCYFVPTYGATSLPAELIIKSDATGIENVNKNNNKTGVKKYVKEGKLVIETAKGTFSATGSQVR